MSRKKAGKGKGTSNTSNSSPSSDKDKAKKVPTQSNGVVYPSRPSLSNSGEFYDIAFKVRTGRTNITHSLRRLYEFKLTVWILNIKLHYYGFMVDIL